MRTRLVQKQRLSLTGGGRRVWRHSSEDFVSSPAFKYIVVKTFFGSNRHCISLCLGYDPFLCVQVWSSTGVCRSLVYRSLNEGLLM